MRVVAYDQATVITGWAMSDDSKPDGQQVTYGVLRCAPIKGEDINKRGRRMKRLIEAHLAEHSPDYVAFEGTFSRREPRRR
jgi:Holliday junction resolvasome RuvABC endonuclease subunit